MKTLPIDSEASFRRIEAISDSLETAHLHHQVITNDLDEALAIRIPYALDPIQVEEHARVINASTLSETARHILSLVAEGQQGAPHMSPANFRDIYPVSPHNMTPYPQEMRYLIDVVMQGLGRKYPLSMDIGDYLPVEVRRSGDSYPHIDYMNVDDVAQHNEINDSPNIHLTLSGYGTVRVGQVRHKEWVKTLREGIVQAAHNGMTEFEINQQIAAAQIEASVDPRCPEMLLQGIQYLQEALTHPSPYVPLSPGDIFIFQGHQRGKLLPVVHHFQTDLTCKIDRQFAVFRPRIEHKPGVVTFFALSPEWVYGPARHGIQVPDSTQAQDHAQTLEIKDGLL